MVRAHWRTASHVIMHRAGAPQSSNGQFAGDGRVTGFALSGPACFAV
jgi:hypothetical protein